MMKKKSFQWQVTWSLSLHSTVNPEDWNMREIVDGWKSYNPLSPWNLLKQTFIIHSTLYQWSTFQGTREFILLLFLNQVNWLSYDRSVNNVLLYHAYHTIKHTIEHILGLSFSTEIAMWMRVLFTYSDFCFSTMNLNSAHFLTVGKLLLIFMHIVG